MFFADPGDYEKGGLIETLWNVNVIVPVAVMSCAKGLIETLWNVNLI